MNAQEILDREFLEIRAKILELAASLDRIERARGEVDQQPRYQLIEKGIGILASDEPQRAEQVQMLFSRQYDPSWQKEFQSSLS